MTTTYAYAGPLSTVETPTTSTGSTANTVAHITDPAGSDLAEAALTHDSGGSPIYGAPAYLGRNGHGNVVFPAAGLALWVGSTFAHSTQFAQLSPR